MKIEYKQIGTIHSPYKVIKGMPIQPSGAMGNSGHIKILPEFIEGLDDLSGFSHIILLYNFHKSEGYSLKTKPFLDIQKRGVFSTRAPKRPNSIGLSIVKVVKVIDDIISIENVDILDGTPLIDIKPYVPEFDQHPADRVGWLEKAKGEVLSKRSDGRFES